MKSRESKRPGRSLEDERHDLEEEIQKLTDKYVKEVDSHAETKEVDIMKV